MFEKLFKRPHALKRQMDGPLAEERRRFLADMAVQGMKRGTIRAAALYLVIVVRDLSLGSDGHKLISPKEIDDAAARWAHRERKPRGMFKDRYSRLRFTCFATRFLTFLGRLGVTAIDPQPFDDLLADYIRHMRDERGLSEPTIRLQSEAARALLEEVCAGGRPLSDLKVDEVDKALAQQVAGGHYSRATVQTRASALRAFFRYAEARKLCRPELSTHIMAPRVFQRESLPSAPSWSDVQKVLASTTGDRPTEIRDHAILLLLAVYGVRAGEVARLQLDDIDWQAGTIVFIRSKLIGNHSFPLCQTVGEAIIRYLREVRPKSPLRDVFLTMRPPYRAITATTLWPVVARRLRPLGLSIKHHGPHSLRHACATRLINEGLSLKEIGDHLGHRGLETTRIYAKVDLVRLREVASFDLGGLL